MPRGTSYEMEDEDGLQCFYYYDPLTRRTSWIEPDGIAGWQLAEKASSTSPALPCPSMPFD